MKTLIKSLALALTLGIATSAASFAETHPTTGATFKAGIYTTVEGKLTIALDKEKGGSVEIRLTGVDGKVFYSQHVGKNDQTFRAKLNLNELEDGVYQVEVTNGVDTTTQSVTISTKQPTTPSRIISVK